MNLKLFKTLNQEQRDTYGETIPDGKTNDSKGRVISSKAMAGGWAKFNYNESGRLTVSMYSRGAWEECVYSEAGYLLKNIDSTGYWYSFTYDSEGHRLTSIDTYGSCKVKGKVVSREEYDAFINPKPKVTEPNSVTAYWKCQYNQMSEANDRLKSSLYHSNEHIKYLENELDKS